MELRGILDTEIIISLLSNQYLFLGYMCFIIKKKRNWQILQTNLCKQT